MSCGERLTLELQEREEASLAGEDSEMQVRGIQEEEAEGLQRGQIWETKVRSLGGSHSVNAALQV